MEWSACRTRGHVQSPGEGRVGVGAVEQPQEVAGMPHDRGRRRVFHGIQSATDTVPPGCQRRHGAHQLDRPLPLRLFTRLARQGIFGSQSRRHGLQDGHRWGVGVESTQRRHLPRVSLRLLGEPALELIEFTQRGQAAEDEQVGYLFVGGVFGEVTDIVTPVDEPTALAVDVADHGVGHRDAPEAHVLGLYVGHLRLLQSRASESRAAS